VDNRVNHIKPNRVYTVVSDGRVVGHYEDFAEARQVLLKLNEGAPVWFARGYTITPEEDEEAGVILRR
jgi:hypothetical protein